MSRERLVIKPEDLKIFTDKEASPGESAAITAEQLGITWGSPESLDEYGRYPISDTPRIHQVDLGILNHDGQLAREAMRETVFAAHGYRQNGEWVLKDGRRVVDVIEEWNKLRPELKIDFAAVCNPTDGVQPHLTGVGHIAGSDLVINGFLNNDSGSVPQMFVRSASPEGVITTSDGRKIML